MDTIKNLKETATELGYLKEVNGVELNDLDFKTLKAAFPKYYQNEKFIRPQTGEPYYSDNISFPNTEEIFSSNFSFIFGLTSLLISCTNPLMDKPFSISPVIIEQIITFSL